LARLDGEAVALAFLDNGEHGLGGVRRGQFDQVPLLSDARVAGGGVQAKHDVAHGVRVEIRERQVV